MVLAYSLLHVPLTFAYIDGPNISTDKSTLLSKLDLRMITAAPKNVDVRIVDG